MTMNALVRAAEFSGPGQGKVLMCNMTCSQKLLKLKHPLFRRFYVNAMLDLLEKHVLR